MEIRQLKYFLKVAETLNFSEASRCLFITQSTLSQQISKLEFELGQQLFARDSINSVSDCMQHMQDLKEMLTGELNIGVTFSFSSIASEAILTFLKKYPKIKLNVWYKTMEELMDMLKRRELDLVLAFKPSQSDSHIDSRVLFNNYLAAIVNEDHPLASHKSITLSELQLFSLVLPSRGLQARNTFEEILVDKDVNLNVCVDLNNVNQILGVVRNSNYVTVLSESTIFNEEGLKAIRLDCSNNNMEGCVHILRDAYIKKSTQEFIKILSESRAILKMFALRGLIKD